MSASGATLSATFSGVRTDYYPQDAGFKIGKYSNSLTLKKVYTTDLLNSASGQFSATVTGLSPSTKYYYQAFMTVSDGNGGYKEIVSETGNFTTGTPEKEAIGEWLEVPAISGSEDYAGVFYGSDTHSWENRNYSYNYNYSHLGCLWVAYPLAPSHISGSASTSSWAKNPKIEDQYQVTSVTGSTSYPSKYGATGYSKGHQIPNADRKSNDIMNGQTYYVTNQTPQIGNKFNGSIWGSLENAIRSEVTDYADTIYVVTGACYQTVNGNETVSQLTGSTTSVTPYKVDVPNYYWKVLLKVKWTGSGDNKTVQSACTIGFWYEHKEYESGTSFSNSSFIKSVNEIEALTGFDLFTNLPGTESTGIEYSSESNKNWQTFLNF